MLAAIPTPGPCLTSGLDPVNNIPELLEVVKKYLPHEHNLILDALMVIETRKDTRDWYEEADEMAFAIITALDHGAARLSMRFGIIPNTRPHQLGFYKQEP